MLSRPNHYTEEQHRLLSRYLAGDSCSSQDLAGLVYQFARSSEAAKQARQVVERSEAGEDEDGEEKGDQHVDHGKVKEAEEPAAFEDQKNKDDEIILA